jgi:hypothetical protein
LGVAQTGSNGRDIVESGITGRNLNQIGKSFLDLDGVVRWTGYSDISSKEIQSILGLFRLLSPLRLNVFLCDLHFDVDHWIAELTHLSEKRFDQLSPLRSTSSFSRTLSLPVHKNKTLLVAFIRGEFNPEDWHNGLSLKSFVPTNDTPLVVIDQATRSGRAKLALALRNIQLMLSVHFDPGFASSFEHLCSILEDDCSDFDNCHDIFLRYRLERMIHSYFRDIHRHRHSLVFQSQKMHSIADCILLLELYVSQLRYEIIQECAQPHFKWYSPEGIAQAIRLDPLTYESLKDKRSFVAPLPVRPSGVPFSERHGFEPSAPMKVTRSPPDLCLWHLASQLNLNLGKGLVFCTRDKPPCLPSAHRRVGEVTLVEALSCLRSSKWGIKFTKVLDDLFNSNSNKFKK